MRAVFALSLVWLLACGGPDPVQPTPFTPPAPGVKTESFELGLFSAGEVSFVMGVASPSNTFLGWSGGQVEKFAPLAAVGHARPIESQAFRGYVTTSAFTTVAPTPSTSQKLTMLTGLRSGGGIAWRRRFVDGTNITVAASNILVQERGKILVLDVRDGHTTGTIAMPASVGTLSWGVALDTDRWALSGNAETVVVDPRTFEIRCQYAFQLNRLTPLGPGIVHVSDQGRRPRVVRIGANCAVDTLLEGAYAAPTDHGTAIQISRSPAPETPFPPLVLSEPANKQLVEIDASGVALRTIALPPETEYVRPARDLTKVLVASSQKLSVLDVASGALAPLPPLGGYAASTLDGKMAIFASPGAASLYVVDLETAKSTSRSLDIEGARYGFKGVFQSSLLVAAQDGKYARMNPATWAIEERILPR